MTHWQRSDVNLRISKGPQITFLNSLFERTIKLKLILKKSRPPTQVRRRNQFLKIWSKNLYGSVLSATILESKIFLQRMNLNINTKIVMESFFQNFISVMSYASWPIFRLLCNISHIWVKHTWYTHNSISN